MTSQFLNNTAHIDGTFLQFAKLPIELRNMTWRLVSSQSSFVIIKAPRAPLQQYYHHYTCPTMPTILVRESSKMCLPIPLTFNLFL
jgi:hypothetical protein